MDAMVKWLFGDKQPEPTGSRVDMSKKLKDFLDLATVRICCCWCLFSAMHLLFCGLLWATLLRIDSRWSLTSLSYGPDFPKLTSTGLNMHMSNQAMQQHGTVVCSAAHKTHMHVV